KRGPRIGSRAFENPPTGPSKLAPGRVWIKSYRQTPDGRPSETRQDVLLRGCLRKGRGGRLGRRSLLFQNDELYAPILAAIAGCDVRNQGPLLAVAASHQAVRADAMLNQPGAHRLGPLFAQELIVLGGSAVVRVPLHF